MKVETQNSMLLASEAFKDCSIHPSETIHDKIGSDANSNWFINTQGIQTIKRKD